MSGILAQRQVTIVADDGSSADERLVLPVLPLRDVVVFPHVVIPLFVGREKSIRALDLAMKAEKRIMLIAQKDEAEEDPSIESLYEVGGVANILQLLQACPTTRSRCSSKAPSERG